MHRLMHVRSQVMLFGVAELLVFLSYHHSDGRFHWFLHFFVGATAALSFLTLWTYGTGCAARLPLLWIFIGHMLAMLPDLLFGLGRIPHEPWMDVFLLHISVHFVPGRNWTWYGLFLLSLASYFAALWLTEVNRQAPALKVPRHDDRA